MRHAFLPVLLVLLLAPMFSAPGAALITTLPFDVETVSAAPPSHRMADAVARPDGTLIVASTVDGPGPLRLAVGRFGDWRLHTLPAAAAVARDPSIVRLASPGERIGIAYHDAASGDLRYIEGPVTGPWTDTLVDALGTTGLYPNVALTGDGRPAIAYTDASRGVLRYAQRLTGNVWVAEDVAAGAVGVHMDVVIQGDMPAIVFHDAVAANLRLAEKGAATWTVSVLDPEPGAGWFASAVTNSAGDLFVAYRNPVADALMLLRRSGLAVSTTLLDATPEAGMHARLARDGDGRLVVTYKAEPTTGHTELRIQMGVFGGPWARATVEDWDVATTFHDRTAVVSIQPGLADVFYRRDADGFLRHARVWGLAADFTWSPDAPTALTPVTFVPTTESWVGPVVSYAWDFAGLGVSAKMSPVFQFPATGTYPVTLVVATAAGLTASVTHDVDVGAIPPRADIDGPALVTQDRPFTLDGRGSYDPDGYLVRHTWFLPGRAPIDGALVTATLPGGVWNVRLEVEDNDGLTDDAVLRIEANNLVVLVVELTQDEYSMFEPHDGRVRVRALQGGAIPGVRVDLRGDGGWERIIEDLPLGLPQRRLTVTTDDLGRAEFQFPLGLTQGIIPGGPEVLTLPDVPGLTENHRVVGTVAAPWRGGGTDSYRVALVPGQDIP